MCYNISEISIKELLNRIENKDNNIGAGSISAINCAFSCSILKNIINSEFIDNNSFSENKEDILITVENCKNEFLKISEIDIEVLKRLIDVFSNKEKKQNSIDEICKEASDVPILLLKEIKKLMKLIDIISSINIGPLKTEMSFLKNTILCCVKNAFDNVDINFRCIENQKIKENIMNDLFYLKEFYSIYI